MFDELTHLIQVRLLVGRSGLGWHTIAAFDCEQAATRYKRECEANSLAIECEYRLVEIKP